MSKKDKSPDEIGGFLSTVERIGNALPHPAMIFLILSVIIILISGLGASRGWNAPYTDARTGEEITVTVNSLLNADGLRYIFNSAVDNYTGFAPLGTVLVAMLGVGVAEYSGLIETSLKKLMSDINPRLLTAVVVFAGIMSNIASDAGYVVVIPLGAMIFAGAGRHPIAGLAAAFSGVSGGFSANLLIGTLDPLLQGMTNAALESAGIAYRMDPTGNWYFLIVSTFMLTIVGSLVTERIVEKNLGEYTGSYLPNNEPITDREIKGLRNAGIALLIFGIIMGSLMVGPFEIFQELDMNGDMNLTVFFNSGLLLTILLVFLIPGFAYGKTTGTIKNTNELVTGMTSGMRSMAGYLVLAFFAAQFVSYFNQTQLGTILSVKGADFLQGIGFTGFPLIVAFVVLAAFINLFMGSASAKWAIMAPIFVPMMANLNLSPELTQVAYRIGDSTTNLITPLMSYFAMIAVFAKRYDEDSGLGTLISTMLPYSIAFLISWIILLAFWYVFNLPLGPGAKIHFDLAMSVMGIG